MLAETFHTLAASVPSPPLGFAKTPLAFYLLWFPKALLPLEWTAQPQLKTVSKSRTESPCTMLHLSCSCSCSCRWYNSWEKTVKLLMHTCRGLLFVQATNSLAILSEWQSHNAQSPTGWLKPSWASVPQLPSLNYKVSNKNHSGQQKYPHIDRTKRSKNERLNGIDVTWPRDMRGNKVTNRTNN